MHLPDLARSSWQSLVRTRNRSILTILGIVIGISAVILALSLGESAQAYILSQMSAFGSDQLIVNPGPRTQMENPSPFTQNSLTLKDAERLLREPWLDAVSGGIYVTDDVSARGVTRNVTIVGALPDEIVIFEFPMADGAFISMSDVDSHSRVAVLGSKVADDLFGQDDPISKLVKIGDAQFRVIGLMKPMGTQMMQDMDRTVYVPLTAASDLSHNRYLEYIIVKTAIPLDEAQSRLEVIMREAHNIENPENDPVKDDFFIMTKADAVKSIDQVSGALQILLSSIAAISLLVGGIGIMNIMFVSVTERISEIGLRKAVGARGKDVLTQFLTEAVFLTVAGGAFGIILGSLLAWIAIQAINAYTPGWTFTVSVTGVVLGFTVSTLIGLTFGYFPARRAARLHPIESLRAE
ncbi:ABC transporter permease [Patescibacteria group bacterium]|nr:ABC transporter permease [Patescibacteria group bacterium]MBU1448627.1 ABC transporter permease [Patescibacteria group bacterium]MBU2613414.1 ABC transporter permease [Patescibacteria group bacterium]